MCSEYGGRNFLVVGFNKEVCRVAHARIIIRNEFFFTFAEIRV